MKHLFKIMVVSGALFFSVLSQAATSTLPEITVKNGTGVTIKFGCNGAHPTDLANGSSKKCLPQINPIELGIGASGVDPTCVDARITVDTAKQTGRIDGCSAMHNTVELIPNTKNVLVTLTATIPH